MNMDPELLKKLTITFQLELEELLQVITNGLLKVEENSNSVEFTSIINEMFRAAHTIKGGARSLGINNIGEISHRIESLFSRVQKQELNISSQFIDLILSAIDKIREAMQAFVKNEPLTFDLEACFKSLDTFGTVKQDKTENSTSDNKEVQIEVREKKTTSHLESIRISIAQINKIGALMETFQGSKIVLDDQSADLKKINQKIKEYGELYRKSGMLSVQREPLGYDCLIEIEQIAQQLELNMRNSLKELSTSFNSLQDEIVQLRLVPVANLLNNLPRYVRDVAHSLQKQVELSISGDEVKLDKMVLESLQDPILHVLRNAIDHGIESSSQRIQKGKSEAGHINIQITEEGNQVFISIADDGAGIDVNAIKSKALKKNLYTDTALQTMSDKEILEIIFLPCFSTNETVTELSGRGVGLDIVKTNLMQIKGKIEINTKEGQGTTFCFSVPRTLTGERGLVIESGKQLFMMPAYGIEKVIAINPADIFEVNQSQMVMHEDHPVPLYSLANLLNLKKTTSFSDNLFTIIIKKNELKIALLVDEVLGEREIVVKPVQNLLAHFTSIVGGALYGNNEVMFVLSPTGLINKALHMPASDQITFGNNEPVSTKPEVPHILVVDDSITTRTLEKNILESKNYQVTIAVNGKEAWDLLQTETFSLLITDVNMPIMDGFALTEQVKKDKKTKNLPVIIVTALGSDEEKKRGIDSGADAYIVKSEFESGALLDLVSQLV